MLRAPGAGMIRRMASLREVEPALWRRLFAIRREERASVAVAVVAFACVLYAVFLLRPLRDEMGLRGGARQLKYVWTWTLVGTVLASLAFAALASRTRRRTFVGGTYRAVALVWLAFLPAVLALEGEAGIAVALAFYVVHAVSNVFLVSLFWALLADLLGPSQSRRLFGLIAVGGTLGAIAGTATTGVVARYGLAIWMIVPAALLLELAVRAAGALSDRVARAPDVFQGSGSRLELSALGGGALGGVWCVLRSPYLQGIALFTFTFGVVQTFFVFQQNHIVEAALPPGDERIAYFAWSENAAQTLTLLVQLFVTGRLMRRVGVGGALLVLPVLGVLGFSALGWAHTVHAPALALVTGCLIAWRGLNHATLRPAREALYVPTAREEKFKAKSFTDTFAFRGGDLAGAWSFGAFTLASAAFWAVPLAAAWGGMGAWLARRQRALAEAVETGSPAQT